MPQVPVIAIIEDDASVEWQRKTSCGPSDLPRVHLKPLKSSCDRLT
jgi:hypothetical protein